jgi:uncharacterized protein
MSATIDQQFIEYIVRSLVSKPDAVSIERTIDEKGVLLLLTVDQEDLGRVIGKRGSGAQALRTLLRALGTKNDARYNLKIVDVNEGERPARAYDRDVSDQKTEEPAAQESVNEESQVSEPAETEQTNESVPAEEPAKTASSYLDDIRDYDDKTADEPSSSVDKTRRELADLDDLDI